MNQSSSKKEEGNKEKESEAIHSISEILQTGLNKRSIAILTELIELGIEPESLVDGNYRLCQRFLLTSCSQRSELCLTRFAVKIVEHALHHRSVSLLVIVTPA